MTFICYCIPGVTEDEISKDGPALMMFGVIGFSAFCWIIHTCLWYHENKKLDRRRELEDGEGVMKGNELMKGDRVMDLWDPPLPSLIG